MKKDWFSKKKNQDRVRDFMFGLFVGMIIASLLQIMMR